MNIFVATLLGKEVTIERIQKALWAEFGAGEVTINISEMSAPKPETGDES